MDQNQYQYTHKLVKIDDDDENSPQNTLIVIETSDLQLSTAAKIHRSNIVMAKYLYKLTDQSIIQNIQLLELCSGTGLVSMFMARLGHRVLMTDNSRTIQLGITNLKKNGLQTYVDSCVLNDGIDQQIQQMLDKMDNLDMIVGCELFNDRSSMCKVMKLVGSICGLMKQKGKLKGCGILLAVKVDQQEWSLKEMLEDLEEWGFEGDEVKDDELHEMYRDRYIRILELQYLDTR